MNTKWEPVKMCAQWIADDGETDWPEGYQPICVVMMLGKNTNLVILGPIAFLEKADALSVMNLVSDTIKRELRDAVRSDALAWLRVDAPGPAGGPS